MRVHHLCCLTMCPPFAPLVDGGHRWLSRGTMICHCLLVETPKDGLVLVDTAIGLQDCKDPRGRLGALFSTFMLGQDPPEENTAIRQIERMGFKSTDVRHIIVTHLDVDHAGGIPDFPHASVHLMQDEQDAALKPLTYGETHRYRPQHFAHGPKWVGYRPQGERWRGLEAVRQLEGLPPEILLVPLPGHTRGHTAVAVEADGGTLLHCGDAYFHGGTLDCARGKVPVGLRVFEGNIAIDRQKVRDNHARLRELRASSEVRIFCAHDPQELKEAQAAGGTRA